MVPPAGRASIVNDPPSSVARCRIESRPTPRPGVPAGGGPVPSSPMVSSASSPAVPRVIWHCRARACRLTLASASPAMRKIAVSAAADSGGTGPMSTRTCRPLAVANWFARVRSASARPRSSRIAGRRSSTIRRTSAMAVRS